MRISDWSSDVCSSDLPSRPGIRPLARRHDDRTDRIGPCRGALGRTATVRHVDPHRHRHCFGDAAPAIRLSATERTGPRAARAWPPRTLDLHRSEEHTSELQSLMRISYAVFCLKNKKVTTHRTLS